MCITEESDVLLWIVARIKLYLANLPFENWTFPLIQMMTRKIRIIIFLPLYEVNRKWWSKYLCFSFFFNFSSKLWDGGEKEERACAWTWTPSWSEVRIIFSCYNITCPWREGECRRFYLSMSRKDRMFWSHCLESHVFPANGISVDADLCITSSSHIDLVDAVHGYPIRLVKPSDVNLIRPLKLNCALAVDVYPLPSSVKVESLMNWFDVIITGA